MKKRQLAANVDRKRKYAAQPVIGVILAPVRAKVFVPMVILPHRDAPPVGGRKPASPIAHGIRVSRPARAFVHQGRRTPRLAATAAQRPARAVHLALGVAMVSVPERGFVLTDQQVRNPVAIVILVRSRGLAAHPAPGVLGAHALVVGHALLATPPLMGAPQVGQRLANPIVRGTYANQTPARVSALLGRLTLLHAATVARRLAHAVHLVPGVAMAAAPVRGRARRGRLRAVAANVVRKHVPRPAPGPAPAATRDCARPDLNNALHPVLGLNYVVAVVNGPMTANVPVDAAGRLV